MIVVYRTCAPCLRAKESGGEAPVSSQKVFCWGAGPGGGGIQGAPGHPERKRPPCAESRAHQPQHCTCPFSTQLRPLLIKNVFFTVNSCFYADPEYLSIPAWFSYTCTVCALDFNIVIMDLAYVSTLPPKLMHLWLFYFASFLSRAGDTRWWMA